MSDSAAGKGATLDGLHPALALWPATSGGQARLVNHSENHTFRVDTPAGMSFALRVHRSGYQSDGAIGSELAWLVALSRDTGIRVPRPIAGRDGALIQKLPFGTGGQPRSAVLFAFEPGEEPQPHQDLSGVFEQLGAIAADCHAHAESWRRPPAFERPAWTAQAILDPGPWGDWRSAPGVGGIIRVRLDELEAALRCALLAYGSGPDRFGLIHADMRLANLLQDGGRLTLIDFDDCGLGWHMYDFAAAISFLETDPRAPQFQDAWVRGYRRRRPLADEHVAILPAMVLLRRMALLAWIGSHGETALAQAQAAGFARDTAKLAEAWLGAGGRGERLSMAAVTPQMRPAIRK